ncbi:hypothetical protein [Caulobacter endophyticus]|uniref:hypothetical protein n=1 Tax=Caulobacter endophyticus TaxID=2172652 RepID=UPI00240EDCFD|nr:hypothetical protein [Caulobacter endophyticus]
MVLLWAFSCIVGGVYAACRFHGSSRWKLVDPAYYLLGMAGVLLLFYSARSDRQLLRMQTNELVAERTVADLRARQPKFDDDDPMLNTIDDGYRDLSKSGSGHYCSDLVVDGACWARKEQRERFLKRFGVVGPPPSNMDPAARIRYSGEYCLAANGIMEDLSRVSGGAELMFKAANDALQETKLQPALVESPDTIFRLRSRIHAAKMGAIRLISGLPRDDRDFTRANIEAEGEFAILAFNAASVCSNRLKSLQESQQRYDAWRKELTRAEDAWGEARQAVQAAAGSQPRGLEMKIKSLLQNLWPWLLILAAAIKFAKSLADLKRKGATR